MTFVIHLAINIKGRCGEFHVSPKTKVLKVERGIESIIKKVLTSKRKTIVFHINDEVSLIVRAPLNAGDEIRREKGFKLHNFTKSGKIR